MSTRKQQAFEMFRQGRTGRQIAELLHVKEAAVSQWKGELMASGWTPTEKERATSLPDNFHARWTATVNRIRRYMGKEEFKVPAREE